MSWFAAGIVLLIPTYLVRLTVFGLPTNLFEVLVVFGVLLQISTAAGQQQLRQAVRRVPPRFYWWTGALLLAALISVAVSDVPRVSWGILKGWFVVPMLAAGLVFTARGQKSGIEHTRLIADALVVSGAGTALLALFFFVPGERLAGIYDVPNSLALWLAPLAILAVGQGLQEIKEQREKSRARYYFIAALVMFGALLLTQSVAGILVTLGVGAAALFRHVDTSKQRRFLLRLTGVTVAVCLFLWGAGRIQYFFQPNTSLAVRQQLWSVSLDLIHEQPLRGVGLGQFEPAYQAKLHERFQEYEAAPLREFVFRDPHNWILSFWLNTGLLGLVSFALLNYHALRGRLWQPAGLALVTLLLFGLVDTIYWKNDLATLHWVLLALLARSYSQDA